MRVLFILAAFLFSLSVAHARAHPLEEGVALTDPELMQRLDRVFGVGQMLGAQPEGAPPMVNSLLFNMTDLRKINKYITDRSAEYKRTVGAGSDQFLDDRFLNKGFATFQLTGVVNRMDRAFVPGHREQCGEVRFIYRLFYNALINEGGANVKIKSRLPFTLNLVLNARTPADGGDLKAACAAVANRWLAPAPAGASADETASFLRRDGALKGLGPAQIDRIELNFQIMRLAANESRPDVRSFGGRAEYIMAAFKKDAATGVYERNRMENQVYLPGLSAKEKAKLRRTVLNMRFFRDLDNGTAILPGDLSPLEAVSVAPGGSTRTMNRPFDGFFTPDEFKSVKSKFSAANQGLSSIKTYAGFVERLNDLTCNGCHQQRAIAGFHFPGADWKDASKINSVFVPGSSHFYGDLPRRKDVVTAFAAGTPPDFRRGFVSRPEPRYFQTLSATQIADGWGAPCYKGTDPSFSAFRGCKIGLVCEVISASERIKDFGMCQPSGDAQLGDALELTKVTYGAPNKETLSTPLSEKHPDLKPPTYTRSFQRGMNGAGGFPGGMLRLSTCDRLGQQAAPDRPESICVSIASNGFNDCLGQHDFDFCVRNFTKPGGARACDVNRPCREDYICTSVNDSTGVCIPPYFVFQFRVDKHHPERLVQPTR